MGVSSGRRRAHVVMSNDLLQQIDSRVGQRKRSEFIQEAIEEKLGRLRRVEAFERVVGAGADGDVPEWETRESTAEWLQTLPQNREADNPAVAANSCNQSRRICSKPPFSLTSREAGSRPLHGSVRTSVAQFRPASPQ
jgi:Arc/MetJ-type ribon-helix-helix transcriptional regulator